MRRPLHLATGLCLAAVACLAGLALPPPAWSAAPPSPVAPPPSSAPAMPSPEVAPTPEAAPDGAPIGPVFDHDVAMAPTADPVASYTLQAALDPVKHTVEGHGTITWRNASRVPQQEVWLHLYMNAFKNGRSVFMRFPDAESFRGSGSPTAWGSIAVTRFALKDGGQDGGPGAGADLWPGADKTSPGDADDETDIRVPLPAPVAPGQTVKFDVAFTTQLPSLLFRTGYLDGFYMVGQWFPKLARLSPDGRWAHFTFHHLSEFYADFGDYDVTVDTPADMVVGATGQPAGEVRLGDRLARRFTQTSVHDFAFTAWSKFQELTALSEGGVAIRLLFPPGFDKDAAVELDSVRFGLKHLGSSFGRYPYQTLTVVHPPQGAEEAGGMEYPTLITTGGPWYLPWTGARAVDVVTVHELGHQWFYGLVATDEHVWPFLDEGLNSYAEVDTMEALVPGASGYDSNDFLVGPPDPLRPGDPGPRRSLAVGISAINRRGAADHERNAPVAQGAVDFLSGGDYGALVYQRTATIMETLANVYGQDLVRTAVGRYTRRYRFQHPGPDALLQAVREVVGEDAAVQLRAALFDRATVDYAVDDLRSEAETAPVPVGGTPPPPATGYTGSALLYRRGTLRFPVDVDFTGADGSVQRVRWDAKESVTRLPYHGPSALAAVVIDPEHRVLLDDDLSNNARRISPSHVSGGLLDRFAFAVEALLSGLLP